MTYPLPFTWDGETMTPARGFAKRADEQFVIGESYRLSVEEHRSDATHKHEFAWLREAHANLPEHLAALYPTPEHLRKRALIEAGYYNETIVDAGSNAAALRVAAAMRGMDDFAHVVVHRHNVLVRTAKSQSRRAMDKAEFQASKSAIMDMIADMIGVAPTDLARAA